MKWKVTYRDKDGKREVSLFDAESRAALFNVLSAKGISAISIADAENIQAYHLGWPTAKVLVWAGVSIGVVAAGTIAIMAMSSKSAKPASAEKAPRKIKIASVRPVNVKTNVQETAETPPLDPSIISVRKTINPFTGEEMMFTNRHKQVKANAGIISRESLAKNKHKPKRKLFKHHSENYICGLMRTPLGMPIVRGRLPKNFDEDFVKSYAEEIKIEPEDTEEDIALKQAMIDFKEEIRDQIANGESVSKMVLESREEQNKLAECRKNLMRTIADLRREGATTEELNEVRKAANVMLDQKGLKRIPEADLPRKGEEEP